MHIEQLPHIKFNAFHIKAIAEIERKVKHGGTLANSMGGGKRVVLADRKGGNGSLSLTAKLL